MASSISNVIKDFILCNKFQNDSNLLIHSKEIISFKRMIQIISKKRNFSKILKKEDILPQNGYFFKHLSLLQNIKFHSNINQINAFNFLKDFNLEKDYEELKYKFFRNCDKKKWSRFEASFFLNAHSTLLINKIDFFNSLGDDKNIINSLITDKQIFLLTHGINLNDMSQFFDVFIYINNNDYMLYENSKDFMMKVREHL